MVDSRYTRLIAESYGATFVSSRRGRGAQMNAATLQATGKYYLFLHADSCIDDVNLFINALQALRDDQLEINRTAGHFFVCDLFAVPHVTPWSTDIDARRKAFTAATS